MHLLCPADVDSVVDPIRPAPRQLAYRNKVTFAAAAGAAGAGGEAATTATASRPASRRRRNARAKHEEAHVADRALAPGMSHPGLSMTLGLRDRSSPSLVVPVSECLLQPAPANAVLQALQSAIASVSPRHLRRAVLRSGLLPNSSEERVVVDLQVARECRRELLPIAEGLLREHAGIVSGVTMSVCPGGDPSAVPEGDAEVLAGCGDLEVLAGGVRLRVSPRSFTQTNPEQAETLYALVRQAAGLTGKETVLDLVSGEMGT